MAASRIFGRPQPGDLGFELDDAADAREVDPIVGEQRDAAQPGEVIVAVPAGSPVGAGGSEQAGPLVRAQDVRAEPGQLGHHRDRVEPVVRVHPETPLRSTYNDITSLYIKR